MLLKFFFRKVLLKFLNLFISMGLIFLPIMKWFRLRFKKPLKVFRMDVLSGSLKLGPGLDP